MDKVSYPFRAGDQTPYGEYQNKIYRGPYVFIKDGIKIMVHAHERKTLDYLCENIQVSDRRKQTSRRHYIKMCKLKRAQRI